MSKKKIWENMTPKERTEEITGVFIVTFMVEIMIVLILLAIL